MKILRHPFRDFRSKRLTRDSGTPPWRQGGAASLFVVLVLLLALTLIVLSMGRVGVQEQTITGNYQRSAKAFDAAYAGVEYGMDWLTRNVGADFDTLADGSTAVWPQSLVVPANITPGAGENYQADVTITRSGTDPYVKVTGRAFDLNEATTFGDSSSARAEASQYAALSIAGNPNNTGSPPLVLNGCFNSKSTGTPDIYPASSGPYSGDAILAATDAETLAECQLLYGPSAIDPKAMCDCPTTGETPHLELNGGDVEDSLSGNPANLDTWYTLFPGMDQDDFIALSDDEAAMVANNEMRAEDRTYFYVPDSTTLASLESQFGGAGCTGSGSPTTWHVCMGSGDDSTSPPTPIHLVAIYIDAALGCPKLNGNTVIWGILYYGGDCNGEGEGFGAGTVYGGIGAESGLDTWNANAEIYALDLSGLGPAAENDFNVTLVRVFGSWIEGN